MADRTGAGISAQSIRRPDAGGNDEVEATDTEALSRLRGDRPGAFPR